MKNKYLIIWTALVVLFSCDDPYQDDTYQAYDEYPSSTYLDTRQEDFSKWIGILHYADLYNALNQASETFTLFVPDNEAVSEFYEKKGVSSIEELGKDYARDLVQFHTINAEITQKAFLVGGKLTTPTVSGDYLTVSFDESGDSEGGLNSIYLNGEALVTELANETTNGLVYVLDAVLTPLTETLYDRLQENDDYSIFREAVELSGWQKRLDSPYDTVYSTLGRVSYLKKNFTLLAVTNTVFAQEGVNDIDGLISELGASSDYTDNDNALHRYVGYHLVSLSQYAEDLFPFEGGEDSTIIWSTQAEKEVFSTHSIGGSYYINYNKSTGTGISLVEGQTDIKAKNGIIHQINNYMPVWSPDPVTVTWDLCEYDDVASVVNAYGAENDLGDCYQQYQSSEYKISLMGDEITSYTWKAYSSSSTSDWPQLAYLLTKANSGSTVNTYGAYKNDMLIVNLGYMGNVSMESPSILKGKYQVVLYYACVGSLSDFINGGSKCQFSLDDQSSEVYVYDGAKASVGIYSLTLFNEIEFDDTGSKTLKLVLMDARATNHSSYRLQLDYVKFIPVTD
jgi:uncharacterized surface protein with fasciclin (FAS1) repeats